VAGGVTDFGQRSAASERVADEGVASVVNRQGATMQRGQITDLCAGSTAKDPREQPFYFHRLDAAPNAIRPGDIRSEHHFLLPGSIDSFCQSPSAFFRQQIVPMSELSSRMRSFETHEILQRIRADARVFSSCRTCPE
jgi:hypothetical protein